VNGLNWIIEHQCPQCGAPVILEETDRIFACAFCRTRLFINTSDHLRYCIPPPAGVTGEVIYIPYWRIRGLAYHFQPLSLTDRYIDVNLKALDMPGLPPSLGLRPQAMTLKFASSAPQGTFIKPLRTLHDVMPETDRTKLGIHHELFIGEITSLIYTPLLRKNDSLYDPFLQKPVAAWPAGEMRQYPAEPADNQMRYIPTHCPQCGWDLQGEKDALVLLCGNCHTAWTCEGETFRQIPFAVMNGRAGQLIYLPFWRIKPRIRGLQVSTIADLVRLANLPRVITAAMEETPLYCWSPAFKVHPALFLRWSRQMTIFQPKDNLEDKLPSAVPYPVTLPLGEAIASMLVTLGSIMTDKRTFFGKLTEIDTASDESLLVFHPFIIGDREMTHEKMGLVIEKNALKYGVTM